MPDNNFFIYTKKWKKRKDEEKKKSKKKKRTFTFEKSETNQLHAFFESLNHLLH